MVTPAASEYSIDSKLSVLVEQARLSAVAMHATAEAVDAVVELMKRVPQQQATPETARGFVRDLGLESEKFSFTFQPIYTSPCPLPQAILKP
jgi:U3 small nucleolar RNA-associated protein 22